jgi:hypothetical protein
MVAVVSLAPSHRESVRGVGVPTGLPGRSAGAHRQVRPRTARCTRGAAVYRRRRLLAAAIGLGLVLTVARAGAALGGVPTTAAERHPHVETIVVQPGDTMWSIAERLAPDRDPRAVVDALVEARGSATLVPGETITWLRS